MILDRLPSVLAFALASSSRPVVARAAVHTVSSLYRLETSINVAGFRSYHPQTSQTRTRSAQFAHQFALPPFDPDSHLDTDNMAKGGKTGFYAVQKGRSPGIYKTWAECEAAVKGFAGAIFKKFPTHDLAQQFVRADGWVIPTESSNPEPALGKRKSISPPTCTPSRAQASHKRDPPPPLPKKRRTASDVVFPPSAASSTAGPTRKTVVYCDGSSFGNGKWNARAGWAVYFEDPALHHLNESRRLPGEPQTNNRAELMALIRAIQLCPNDGRELVIFSDSQYSMDAATKWLPNWRQKGFKTVTGKDVSNKDLIVQLDEELTTRFPKPKLAYVKAHAGNEGNELADKMAKFGASLPKVDSFDLSKRSSAPESHIYYADAQTQTPSPSSP